MSKKEEISVEPRSLIDLKLARETRANETLQMKDEQINILTEQNKKLIDSLNKIEEESSSIQIEKIALEEENQSLRDSNLEAQSKARAADGALERIKEETSDRDKQLSIMTEQNGELLRLLETEEANNARLSSECENQKNQTREYREKYEVLEKLSKEHQDISSKATYEGHLKSEEARILKAEIETLKHTNNELQMKTSVEIEGLQEQLRVRKEKQYQLLEKLQLQEEERRQAEDQVAGMEEKIRELSANKSETETQLQLEINSKLSQLDANKKLSIDTEMLSTENKELTEKYQKTEHDRLRMEAEARDSGEQLREMAEKVFQLLERLKLAELGKNRSMDALRKKEQEVQSLKKKNSHLIKENTKEGKARMKAELEKKETEEHLRSIKKQNTQLAQKCKDECKLKLKEEDGRKESQEKIKTLNGRISFLLNKLQSDEEAKSLQKEETKKMEMQLSNLLEKCDLFQQNISELEEIKKNHIEELRLKQEELNATQINLCALQKISDEQDEEAKRKEKLASLKEQGNQRNGVERRLAGGRLRFFVDNKPALGIVLIKGKCAKDRDWLEEKGCNAFLRRAMKSSSTKEMLIQKIAELHGTALVEEEELKKIKDKMKINEDTMEILKQKNNSLQRRISDEEDSKRQTLIRYVNAVKVSVSLGEPGSEKEREEVGRLGAGRICLPEACLTDEETHAITATLRGNQTVVELNLRNNRISDDGAVAIASLLAGETILKLVDLRGNQISRTGLKSIVEALERSERVRHVYVHTGGKIEALGISGDIEKTRDENKIENEPTDKINTVCVVDLRDNSEKEKTASVKSNLCSPKKSKKNDQASDAGISFHNKSLKDYMNENQTKKTIDKARKKANEVLKKEERERKRKAKQLQVASEKEKALKEQGWMGRSGGMDARINRSNEHDKHPQKTPMTNEQKCSGDLGAGFPPSRPYSAGRSI